MAAMQQLDPDAALAGGRMKQQQEAKEMGKAVRERAQRMKVPVPPYDFMELIGKGAYGRVFKGRSQEDNSLVAVKIIDVDKSDYGADADQRDQAIKDFINETTVLQQLKDSRAQNINIIYDAFDWHSQLWIVSEYCPGGSVYTLMKAGPQKGLEEIYVVPIARELAIALKHVHEIGIIHRDVKAANILITQDGHLQLCDFGVSGVLKTNTDKRSTIIGTPYWMAPEMLKEDALPVGYGFEVDIWAYGIALIELATGLPPNTHIAAYKLHMFMDKPPKLEGDNKLPGLADFVDFCLKTRPEERPTSEQLLKHTYLKDSEKRFPTTHLKSLIDRFYRWEQMGGQRTSLYTPNGAAPLTLLDGQQDNYDGWIFSTTDDFSFLNRSVSSPVLSDPFLDEVDAESMPKQPSTAADTLTPFERAKALRGERALARIFDTNTIPYEYSESEDDEQPLSDLPLRNVSSELVGNRNTLIDLDAASDLRDVPILDLADIPTIRANKPNRFLLDDEDEEEDQETQPFGPRPLTRDWKFPSALSIPGSEKPRPKTMEWSMAQAQSDVEEDPPTTSNIPDLGPPFRPKLKHATTEPLGVANDFIHPEVTVGAKTEAFTVRQHSMIDLDDIEYSRPTTAGSMSSSVEESFSSDWTSGDPFDLDAEFATTDSVAGSRGSFHMHSQSEPPLRPSSQRSFRRSASEQHARSSSMSSDDGVMELSRPSTALSVNQSVDSLRRYVAAEAEWDQYVQTGVSASYETAKTAQRPLLSGPASADFFRGDLAQYSDAHFLSSEDADPDLPASAPRRNKGASPRARYVNGNAARGTGGAADLSRDRRGRELHEPVAPNPLVLSDAAGDDLMVAEIHRLLDGYVEGLGAASHLMDRYQAARESMRKAPPLP